MSSKRGNRWGDLQWPELASLPREQTLVVVPTGATEQHGWHLPVDTDAHIATEIALRAAVAVNETFVGNVVVAPPIPWGTSPHHLGYPGTISLRMETMSNLVTDVCRSIYKHGFYRILILNGHGGNAGVLAATALRISEEVGVSIAVTSYWSLITDALREIGESPPGGMGHACEMETSIELYLRGPLVDMSRAVASLPRPATSYSAIDFRMPGAASVSLDFVRDSTAGVMGDPTRATAGKGEAIVAAAVGRVVKLMLELLALSEGDVAAHVGESPRASEAAE